MIDPSSFSLQVLNPNVNFLPQFAHTKSQEHPNIVPQSTGEAKIQELIRSLMEASAGVGGGGLWTVLAAYPPAQDWALRACWLGAPSARVQKRHLSPGWSQERAVPRGTSTPL